VALRVAELQERHLLKTLFLVVSGLVLLFLPPHLLSHCPLYLSVLVPTVAAPADGFFVEGGIKECHGSSGGGIVLVELDNPWVGYEAPLGCQEE
jgi:hypothetical protein